MASLLMMSNTETAGRRYYIEQHTAGPRYAPKAIPVIGLINIAVEKRSGRKHF